MLLWQTAQVVAREPAPATVECIAAVLAQQTAPEIAEETVLVAAKATAVRFARLPALRHVPLEWALAQFFNQE